MSGTHRRWQAGKRCTHQAVHFLEDITEDLLRFPADEKGVGQVNSGVFATSLEPLQHILAIAVSLIFEILLVEPKRFDTCNDSRSWKGVTQDFDIDCFDGQTRLFQHINR